MNDIIILPLIILSGVLWRMGGAEDYDKLWRRIGSALCMTLIVGHLWAVFPIVWGCTSYFGWINHGIKYIWREIEVESEYWWNFAVENFVIQSAVLIYKQSFWNVAFAVLSAVLIALVKVVADRRLSKADIKSELWHGSSNALCLYINGLI